MSPSPQSPAPAPTGDPSGSPQTAVTIGNFDGVHVGHAALVAAAREAVGPEGSVVVLAFDPHPASVLRPGTEPARLTGFEGRRALLERLGADSVERLEPTVELLGQSPEAFIEGVVERHRPSVIVEGPDFHFGKGRAGTPQTLRELAGVHGFEVITVEPVRVGLRDQSVVTASSTLVRWLLEHGRVRDAAVMLGRPFSVVGTVTEGDRRGRTIGFPTANVSPITMVPGAGVYAAIASTSNGRCYPAAVNIGTRPTFEGEGVRVEAHLLDTEDYSQPAPETETGSDGWAVLPGLDEYGWGLELELISRVRDETRFGSVDELVAQLGRDVRHVRDRIGPVGPYREQHLEARYMTPTTTPSSDAITMSETWATNTTLEAIADWLRDQRAVVLITHEKPDGDAIGSTVAVAKALNLASQTSGVTSQAECWYIAPMPGWGQALASGVKSRVIEMGQAMPGALDPSAVLVCDTGSWNQLKTYSEWLRPRAEICAILDHHLQGDAEIAPRRVISTESAAVCEPAAELCRMILGLGSIAELPIEVAEPLYVGLATDTGWFKHSNVSPNVFATAGQLLEAGVDHSKLFELISQRDRSARLSLMARALGNLEIHHELNLAMMSLTPEDFKATKAAPGDSGGFVDLPQSVPSIRVVALLTEQEDADGVFTKISLRSKPTEWDDKPAVDVNKVCNSMGGGGHARAAGAKVRGPIAEARAKLLEALA